MRKKLYRIGSGILCGVLLSIGAAQVGAAAAPQEAKTSRVDTTNANIPEEKGPLGKALEQKRKENGQATKERYVYLLKDNGFAYYLDTQSLRWIKMPYSETENIIEVWVRLTKVDDDGEYSYPPKYFLSHYYIRPKTKQIQFLSELEVTGRPDNAIKERAYSSQHWENLVPGSIEDEVYHGVLKVMKENKVGGSSENPMSFRDAVEEYLRISL
ncbi:hypothetical protein SAMN02910356_02509 [Selenomonas sp. GACV-9]|uniref:hypothetical protein n=1 Tax=Selenomonas sp. GACV-9 TaxID=3158782 RepID=UPI0008E6737F|nr:hypothetical protein SAMN02910356_02509 [Selenomonas ruminantium]